MCHLDAFQKAHQRYKRYHERYVLNARLVTSSHALHSLLITIFCSYSLCRWRARILWAPTAVNEYFHNAALRHFQRTSILVLAARGRW